MATKKPAQEVVQTVTDSPVTQNLSDPNDPRNVPTFTGEHKADYVDINNPKDGNKTYVELQS